MRVQPRLFGPDRQAFSLDELAVRSTQPCGAVVWKSPGANSPAPTLLLSRDQTYVIHAFGHSSRDYAAVWTTLKSGELEKITLKPEQWRSCDFHWNSGSPKASSKGVVLQFPDGKLDVLNPEKARVFTNRRFFTVAYWLAFDGDRKAIFQPRGFVLPEVGVGKVVLGGPLRPLASAAVMQDENLGLAGAQHLWWEILLADSQNYLLDTNASKIDWQPTLSMIDGSPVVTAPLLPSDIERLGNLKDTLIAGASYRMDTKTAEHVSVHPDGIRQPSDDTLRDTGTPVSRVEHLCLSCQDGSRTRHDCAGPPATSSSRPALQCFLVAEHRGRWWQQLGNDAVSDLSGLRRLVQASLGNRS